MNKELQKRLSSLAWRVGSVALISGLGELTDLMSKETAPLLIFIGLISGELTKYLRKRLNF